MDSNIIVLLATYNGSSYIEAQLDSLLAQTISTFSILVHDDGSCDDTVAILKNYQENTSLQISILNFPSFGSAKSNFLYLMSKADSDYFFLCDQDDIWLPNKIEKTLDTLKQLENLNGKDVPLLVHTDLQVVDTHLQLIDSSFSHYVGLVPLTTLKEALMQNDVTGCTAVYNKALSVLLKEHLPAPEKIIMHDWWIALIAHTFGQKEMLPDATILYRQHGNNSVGAIKSYGFSYIFKKIRSFKEIHYEMNQSYIQAGEFLRMFNEALPTDTALLLERFAAMEQMGKFARIRQMRKYGFFRKRTKQKIAQILFS